MITFTFFSIISWIWITNLTYPVYLIETIFAGTLLSIPLFIRLARSAFPINQVLTLYSAFTFKIFFVPNWPWWTSRNFVPSYTFIQFLFVNKSFIAYTFYSNWSGSWCRVRWTCLVRDTFFVNRIISISILASTLVFNNDRVSWARDTAWWCLNFVRLTIFHTFFPLWFIEKSIFTNASFSIRARNWILKARDTFSIDLIKSVQAYTLIFNTYLN